MSDKIFRNSFIYFVQGELTRLIKIGKTNTPIEKRIKNLQTSSPDRLVLLGAIFEPIYYEEELHKKYSKHREHGEWFLPDDEILDFIKSYCFTSIDTIYWCYFEILSGKQNYEELVNMDEIDLLALMDKENDAEMERFMKSDYMKIVTGEKT